MDKDTREGKIIDQEQVDKVATEIERAIETGDWSKLPFKPKSGCKDCYGRGSLRVKVRGEEINISCTCVMKALDKWFEEHSIEEIKL